MQGKTLIWKGDKQWKSKAIEISELFKWKGYVSDNMKLDINVKGFSAIGDLLSLSWEAIYGKQIDGGVSGAWLQAWLNFLLSRGKAVVYESI